MDSDFSFPDIKGFYYNVKIKRNCDRKVKTWKTPSSEGLWERRVRVLSCCFQQIPGLGAEVEVLNTVEYQDITTSCVLLT
jgi:hypothetical protein